MNSPHIHIRSSSDPRSLCIFRDISRCDCECVYDHWSTYVWFRCGPFWIFELDDHFDDFGNGFHICLGVYKLGPELHCRFLPLRVRYPFRCSNERTQFIAVYSSVSLGGFISLFPVPAAQMGPLEDVGRRTGLLLTILAIGTSQCALAVLLRFRP